MRALLFALPLVLVACQTEPDTSPSEPASEPGVSTAGEVGEPSTRLNLNTASEDDFKALGIGDQMAHEFEEYQPYTSVRVFRKQIGKYINDDAVKLDEYQAMVFVPIDPNASDAETLQQLPNTNASSAQALIDGRPYGSDQAFLDAYVVASPTGDVDEARLLLQ